MLVETLMAKPGEGVIRACPLTPARSRWERENILPLLEKSAAAELKQRFQIAGDIRRFPSPSGRGIKGEGERPPLTETSQTKNVFYRA